MEMLKDCSNLQTHELVPITPLTETIPINSPLATTHLDVVQAMPMLLPLSHLHLQHQQQQSQLVPIQIQQTQPTMMMSSSATSSTVVCIGDQSTMDSEQQLQQLQDAQQSHIVVPMGQESSNGGCLTCLPELPETEDFDDDEGEQTDYEAQDNHNHHPDAMCDGNPSN